MSKASLTYLPHCLVPVLLLAAFSYWNGLRTVDSTLSSEAQTHLNALAIEIDRRLQVEETELNKVTSLDGLAKFVTDNSIETTDPAATLRVEEPLPTLMALLRGEGKFERVGIFDQKRAELLHVERERTGQIADTFVVKRKGMTIFSPIGLANNSESTGLKASILQYSTPIIDRGSGTQVGVLVGELNLNETIADAASMLSSNENSQSASTFIAALDQSAHFIYSNRQLQGSLVSSSLPAFQSIATALTEKNLM